MKTLSNGWTIVAASGRTVLAMHPRNDGRYAVWTERDDGATFCGEYSSDVVSAARIFDRRRKATQSPMTADEKRATLEYNLTQMGVG